MGRAAIIMSGKRNDDGITDRLNYRYTVVILVAFAIINMNRLYTDQIKCWVKSFCLIRYIYMIFFSLSNRYQHSLHRTMMNMFDRYVLFKILIMFDIQIKHRSHIVLKKKVKYCIINGFHFFYWLKHLYSIYHVYHGMHLD